MPNVQWSFGGFTLCRFALLQTISAGRRGPNVNYVDQSSSQGIKPKGSRKAHHAEHSHRTGSGTPGLALDVATSEDASATSNLEPSAPKSGSEAGSKRVSVNGGSSERNRGQYWRGQDHGGFGAGARPRSRDPVRSNNHGWNNQRGFRMNNGPSVSLRAGSRNYNKVMFNNNNVSEFGNTPG